MTVKHMGRRDPRGSCSRPEFRGCRVRAGAAGGLRAGGEWQSGHIQAVSHQHPRKCDSKSSFSANVTFSCCRSFMLTGATF